LVKLSDTDDHQQMNPALRAIAVLNFFEITQVFVTSMSKTLKNEMMNDFIRRPIEISFSS